MRKISSLPVLWLFVSLFAQQAYGQQMLIKKTNGAESARTLTLTSRITFDNNSLVLASKTGREITDLQSIVSLKFKNEQTMPVEKIGASSNLLRIYPNPASEAVHIQNLTNEYVTASVFNLYGRLLMQTKVNASNSSIAVGRLPQGMYVVKINNKGFKFQKL